MKKGKNIFLMIFNGVLVPFLLEVLYFFGIGLTVLFAMIFDRRILIDRKRPDGSTWQDADGYDFDPYNIMRQS